MPFQLARTCARCQDEGARTRSHTSSLFTRRSPISKPHNIHVVCVLCTTHAHIVHMVRWTYACDRYARMHACLNSPCTGHGLTKLCCAVCAWFVLSFIWYTFGYGGRGRRHRFWASWGLLYINFNKLPRMLKRLSLAPRSALVGCTGSKLF